MNCPYCRQIPHNSRCPLAPEQKFDHRCSICDEGIQNGEDYIVNDNGNYAHWDCFNGTRHLADWLGYEIKEMRGENY